MTNENNQAPKTKNPLLVIVSSTLLVTTSAVAAYHALYWNRIYPGVKIAGLDVSGKTKSEVTNQVRTFQAKELVLLNQETNSIITLNITPTYLYEESAQEAFQLGRKNTLLSNSKEKWTILIKGENLPLQILLDTQELEKQIEKAEEQITTPPIQPGASVEKGQIIVSLGKDGTELDKEKLLQNIKEFASFAKNEPIPIPVKTIKAKITEEEAESIKTRAKNLLGKKLEVKFEYQTFTYKDSDLIPLLTQEGVKKEKLKPLVEDIKKAVNRSPQNAKFVFKEARVEEFTPAKDGIETKEQELLTNTHTGIEDLIVSDKKISTIEVPVTKTKPEVSIGEVNNLGIKELIGRGTSRFTGSIPSRIHNIGLAASKFNGILIKPGDTLSVNNILGDVSEYTGYQQAYVIKEGKTVLGDGGGVCQVSTTLFRAALNAGLPITERRAHSYRVSYYEQDSKPGLDATVYSPTTDLKIKNDTQTHILIQTTINKKGATLVFELYGTLDGRVAQVSTPRIWDIIPAPPPLYQDDPTLPAGTTKQIDWAAPGSKASFDYKVTRSGEVLQTRTFYSNYRPWQAVYLRAVAQ